MRATSVSAIVVGMMCVTSVIAQPTSAPTTRPFVPSKETTVVVGPLRQGGTIDYVEALNQLCGKGVTRENNLAIPLLEAMGRGQGAKAAAAIWRERAALGLRGDGGESFVPLREFAQENWREGDGGSPDEAEDRLYALTTKGPWTAPQSPLAARWLEAVHKRLDTVVVGSARDRFYFPMVSAQEPATLIKVDYAYLNAMRELANALKARALLRLGEKDFDGYRRDTIALMRLGRLSAQAPTLIQKLVAIGCEALALSTVQAAAGSTALSAEQCAQLANELRDLPAAPPLSDCFKYAERFQLLDYLVMCAVHGPIQAARMMSGDGANVKPIDTSGKDWNAALRKTNEWYDRLV